MGIRVPFLTCSTCGAVDGLAVVDKNIVANRQGVCGKQPIFEVVT